MDLKHQNGAGVQGDTSAQATENSTPKNGDAKKVTAAAGSVTKTNGKAESGKDLATTSGRTGAELNGLPKTEPVKQEPAKAEPEHSQQPKAKPVAIVLNLEGTLRVVEDLHRRSIQRMNLMARIKQLEAFEVNLTTENDELEENPYQGCKLIIEDDKGRRFVTTTPGLIRLVSQFIFDACHQKLGEIEAHIVLPTA